MRSFGDRTSAQQGAISAEQGIDIGKRVTDPLDVELMRGINQLRDPGGLLNSGKIFFADEGSQR